jgi:hypothetical protein
MWKKAFRKLGLARHDKAKSGSSSDDVESALSASPRVDLRLAQGVNGITVRRDPPEVTELVVM